MFDHCLPPLNLPIRHRATDAKARLYPGLRNCSSDRVADRDDSAGEGISRANTGIYSTDPRARIPAPGNIVVRCRREQQAVHHVVRHLLCHHRECHRGCVRLRCGVSPGRKESERVTETDFLSCPSPGNTAIYS